MRVTIKDIAKKAGVSYATVSRALNNHPDVNQNTRKEIVELAKEMNYQPNAIARSLINKKTDTIGLLIPDITNPFYPEVARGVEETAVEKNYNIFLCNTNWNMDREEHYINALLQKQIDGLIMTPSTEDLEHLEILMNSNLKTVFISSYIDHPDYVSVIVDNIKGVKKAVYHLLKNGHKDICFIGAGESRFANQQRLYGYKQALIENNIEVKEKLIKNEGNSYNIKDGYKLMKNILEDNMKKPTAVICYNDLYALGAIQAIKEKNLNVPQDIAVIGFDDISFASLPEIQLTTVAQPKYQMGSIAFNTLINKMSGNEDATEGNKIVLEPQLIIRKTSC